MLMRTLRNSIIICFCIFMTFCTVYAETVNTNITVDENNIIKPSEKAMISSGDTWDTWRMYLGDENSTETSQRYLDMMNSYKMPVNQQRMSGADANSFFWKDSLGDMEERGDGSPYSRNFGLVEWIKSVMAVNKEADFTFAINIVNDTVENHADLVRFLTLMPDDSNAVGTDGVNWAQRRVDLGIPNPVKIKLFELGNEVYNEGYVPISDTHTVTADEALEGANQYIADCREAIDAMKAVNPDIDFAMCGYSSGNGGNEAACAWNRQILNMLSDDCGYIVDHKYYYDYNFKWITTDFIQAQFTNLINEIPEEKRPQLYYSEYGCWVEGVSAENSMEYLPWPTSLKGALTDAKFLNGFLMNAPEVGMAALFCTSGSRIDTKEQWGAGFSYFRVFDDGNIYATVPAEMLKIFNEAVGNGNEGENVVKTILSAPVDANGVREHSYFGGWNNFPSVDENNPVGEYKTPEGMLTVSSHTTAEEGLNLILVNTNETVGHNIIPYFNNSYKLKEELVLTSESMDDNNIPGTPDKVYTKRKLINSVDEFESHYIPPKSVIVLKLVPLDYKYETESDMLVNFVSQSGYEEGVPAVGGNFGLTCEMYDNKNMVDIEKAILLVPKQGVQATDVINNLSANINEICFMGQADVKRNIAYFNINLGKEPAGRYQAIVGNLTEGKYQIIDFYYRGAEPKAINEIAFKNAVSTDEIMLVSNHEYMVKTEIKFNSEFNANEPCKVTVVRGNPSEIIDREIVNTGYVQANPDGTADYDFYMPTDAINGNYTMVVEYIDSNGEKKIKSAEFNFNKPNEKLTHMTMPKNQNDEEITQENITQAEKVKLQIKNNDVLDKGTRFKAIIAFYGKNKQLMHTAVSDENNTENRETIDMEIILSNTSGLSNIDYIAVHLFGENIEPYSNVYYIK